MTRPPLGLGVLFVGEDPSVLADQDPPRDDAAERSALGMELAPFHGDLIDGPGVLAREVAEAWELDGDGSRFRPTCRFGLAVTATCENGRGAKWCRR